MSGVQTGKKMENREMPRQRLEMFVTPARILLFLHNGEDVTAELEAVMSELGIRHMVEFNSPCG